MLSGVSYSEGAGRVLQVEGTEHEGRFDLALKSAPGEKLHYRAQIEVGGSHPPPPPRLQLVNRRPFPLSVAEAYENWLFHGPLFAGILELIAMGDNGIIGRVAGSRPEQLIRQPEGTAGQWLIDPVAMDSSWQLCLLWVRAMFDQTPLPSGFDAYYHVRPLSGAVSPLSGAVSPLSKAREVLCEVEITAAPGNPNVRCDLRYYDEAGDLLGWMDGLEVTMSKALNRLKGSSTAVGRV
jgi:hypothetical protein